VKRAKVLAHDWSSGRLATAHSIEKLFSATMASRFEIVNEEYIEELKNKTENETRRTTQSGERTFSKSGQMKETCKQI